MRKVFLSVVMVVVMLLAMSLTASAKVQKFGNIIVDLPSGWKGKLQDSKLTIKSSKKKASLVISLRSMEGSSLGSIAKRMCKQMNGEDFEKDSDGDYSFTFRNRAGEESIALITAADDYYLTILVTGINDESVQDDIERIINSLDWED